jgi:hypothetical protein
MSEAESAFLAHMKAERLAIERSHCEAIRVSGGDCRMLNCADCPLECSLVETDDITWHKAKEWLAANP